MGKGDAEWGTDGLTEKKCPNRRHREFRGPGTSEVWGTSITAGLTPHGGRQILIPGWAAETSPQ